VSLALPLPDPEAGGALRRFARGVGFVLRGQRVAFTHPRLRRVSAVATLTAALLYTGPLALLSLGLFLLDWELHPSFERFLHGTWEETAVEGGKWALELLAVAIYALSSFVLSVVVGRLVLGFFCDTLSERTEALLVTREPKRLAWVRALGAAVKEALAQLALLAVHVPLLTTVALLGLWSEEVALGLAWLWGSFWLTLTFTSSVTSSHGLGARARLNAVLGHKALALGFGGLPALMMPILVPLLLPGMVVGGTKLYLSLAAWSEVDSDLSEDARAQLRGESET
jgi:hypothetical protein